jgi:hypothetical protein
MARIMPAGRSSSAAPTPASSSSVAGGPEAATTGSAITTSGALGVPKWEQEANPDVEDASEGAARR